jgi:hypothetical protein
MSTWAEDALWLGPVLCTRLRAQLPELRAAYVIDDLQPESTTPPQDPAAIVMLDGMQPAGGPDVRQPGLAVTTVDQSWLVILAVRSARRDDDRARQQLGALVSGSVRALQGWTPPGALRPMVWRASPRPDYGKAINLFPLRFSLQLTAR